MGYSGRDRDVMAALGRSRPSSITWIVHPGAAPPDAPEFLNFAKGRAVSRIELDAGGLLWQVLTATERRSVRQIESRLATSISASTTATEKIQQDLLRDFAGLGIEGRALAVARLAEHLGHLEIATRLLVAVRKSVGTNPRLDVLLGRFYGEARQFAKALPLLSTVSGDPSSSAEERCEAFVEQAEVLRNASRSPEALALLDEFDALSSTMPQSLAVSHKHVWAVAARAGIARMNGDLRTANQLYAELIRTARRAGDLDGELEALTWQSELRCMQGRVNDAVLDAEAAVQSGQFFSRRYWNGWPHWSLGQALAFNGRARDAILSLEEAMRRFDRGRNDQGIAWTLLALCSVHRDRNLDRSDDYLEAAKSLVVDQPGLLFARARYRFEQAELARARGRPAQARSELRRYKQTVGKAAGSATPPALVELQTRLVLLEIDADSHKFDARAFQSLARESDRFGARGLATRARLGAIRRQGRRIPPSLLDTCSRMGRERELTAFNSPGDYFPIHIA
jgi:tetratricopeptide (TPR) repeat protein